MIPLDNPEAASHRTSWMHDTSLHIVHTDDKEDNAATSVWTTVLNSKGKNDVIDMKCPEMEQMETSRVPESKQQVYNVIPSNIEMEAMITAQISRATEKMASKVISANGAPSWRITYNVPARTHVQESVSEFVTSLSRSYWIYYIGT